MALVVKDPPANTGDNRHGFDPWEDPLQEETATHSSILAWKISLKRGTWRAIVHGVTKRQTRLNMHAGTFSHMVLFVGNNLSTLG